MLNNFLTIPTEYWYTVTILACNRTKDIEMVREFGFTYKEIQDILYHKQIMTEIGYVLMSLRYDFSPDKSNKIDMNTVVHKYIKRIQIKRFNNVIIADFENNSNNNQIFQKKTIIKTIHNTIQKDFDMCCAIYLKFIESNVLGIGGFDMRINNFKQEGDVDYVSC